MPDHNKKLTAIDWEALQGNPAWKELEDILRERLENYKNILASGVEVKMDGENVKTYELTFPDIKLIQGCCKELTYVLDKLVADYGRVLKYVEEERKRKEKQNARKQGK